VNLLRSRGYFQGLEGAAVQHLPSLNLRDADECCPPGQGNVNVLRALYGLLDGAKLTHLEIGIRFDDETFLRPGLPVVTRFTAWPFKIVNHAEREAILAGRFQGLADDRPPLFREIRRLQSIALMGICSVDAMVDHLLDLSADLSNFESSIPKPERTNAEFSIRIQKATVEGRQAASGWKGIRLQGPAARCHQSTYAHCGQAEKASPAYVFHACSLFRFRSKKRNLC